METCYENPRELVQALQDRAPEARLALAQLLQEPLGRLMGELASRNNLPQGRERLTAHALQAAEAYLRTRPPDDFDEIGWASFRGALLFHVGKLASLPFGRTTREGAGPAPLPESACYHSQALSLPCERVGEFWFGGDWYTGSQSSDGSLWVLVADITGHGYFAYLLATTLPEVWRVCWQPTEGSASPAEVLSAMHELLKDCLPDGVYAECTLVRLDPEGSVTVAPAGGSRVLLRLGGRSPDLHKLRGTWLGLARPSSADQRSWKLEGGDELLLGSDGAFDQLVDRLDDLPESVGGLPRQTSLFEAARDALLRALEHVPQRDDITLVLLRRRHGGGDVSV